MSPAKVTTPDGETFYVPKGRCLSRQIGFQLLSQREQEEAKYTDVLGTEEGYKIVDFIGRDNGSIEVSKSRLVDYNPSKEAWIGVNLENGIYTLRDGTEIEPITTEVMNSVLKGKEF